MSSQDKGLFLEHFAAHFSTHNLDDSVKNVSEQCHCTNFASRYAKYQQDMIDLTALQRSWEFFFGRNTFSGAGNC